MKIDCRYPHRSGSRSIWLNIHKCCAWYSVRVVNVCPIYAIPIRVARNDGLIFSFPFLMFTDSSVVVPSDSEILRGHPDYVKTLKEFMEPVQVPGKQWQLCFRASENSYSASAFHAACNNKGPTVTLVRVGDKAFGGYTDKSWDGNPRESWSYGALKCTVTRKKALQSVDCVSHKHSTFFHGSEHCLGGGGWVKKSCICIKTFLPACRKTQLQGCCFT